MRALISVSDKRGIESFAASLAELGVEILSTGGTQKALRDAGIPVKGVSELTGFPEILDGRVKTLHPSVHGGILARRDLSEHMGQLSDHHIQTIDLVVVNLYPFVETVAKEGTSLTEALENIDIGGPTLIRAAAKNFPDVIVVVDPEDYPKIVEKLPSSSLDHQERQSLAQKAFQHVALYDTAIAHYLKDGDGVLSTELTLGFTKKQGLRYGENPHQQGAFYSDVLGGREGIGGATQLWGRELSFNNILDADAAWRVITDFNEPAAAIIKHTNPCGLASHDNLTEAYQRGLEGDPVSAYGGIVAFNRLLTLETVKELAKTFYEIVLAPDFAPEALELLKSKKNLRILKVASSDSSAGTELDVRQVAGGLLVQTRNATDEDSTHWKSVTKRKPTLEETRDLTFAWKAVKHVKSNAIVLVRDKALVGMGAGQPSRVTSVQLALKTAKERSKGSVLASDAFFPFADSVELAVGGGVTAIVQPGGSIRDQEVIDAADAHGLAMLFTGVRHFKH